MSDYKTNVLKIAEKAKEFSINWYKGTTKNKNITKAVAILLIFFLGMSISGSDQSNNSKKVISNNNRKSSKKSFVSEPKTPREKDMYTIAKASSSNMCWALATGSLNPFQAFKVSLNIATAGLAGRGTPPLRIISNYETIMNTIEKLQDMSDKESALLSRDVFQRSFNDCPSSFTPSQKEDIRSELNDTYKEKGYSFRL